MPGRIVPLDRENEHGCKPNPPNDKALSGDAAAEDIRHASAKRSASSADRDGGDGDVAQEPAGGHEEEDRPPGHAQPAGGEGKAVADDGEPGEEGGGGAEAADAADGGVAELARGGEEPADEVGGHAAGGVAQRRDG